MPILLSNNNRVIPANSRSVAVARDTLSKIIPIQNRKYHNAFLVQGFQGILYQRLSSGKLCSCSSRQATLESRLDLSGKAPPGLLNEMLTGGQEFGFRRYGTHAARVPSASSGEPLEVRLPNTPYVLPSLYTTDRPELTNEFSMPGGDFDRYSTDPDDPTATTIVPDGIGTNGPVGLNEQLDDIVADNDFDLGLRAYSDVSCPICYGSGYVGGYSIHNGFRRVLTPTDTIYTDAYIQLEQEIPSGTGRVFEWEVTLPLGAVSIDSLRIYNNTKPVTSLTLYVDSIRILDEFSFLQYCDGRSHRIRLSSSDTDTEITHLEIQINQSTESAVFEFPKLSRASAQSLLESTDPFSIIISPMVPRVSPLDVFVDSSYGKRLQIKSTTAWNDRNRSILGWEAEVRATQPQELFYMLPSRPVLQHPNRPAMVRDNSDGDRRT